MKTPEELDTLKKEAEVVDKKPAKLNEDELEQVIGAAGFYGKPMKDFIPRIRF